MLPELQAAYRNERGLEIAHTSLEDFVGFVIWYSVNSSDYAYQKREAIYKTVHGEQVEGADFQTQAVGLWSELDAMNEHLNQGV